MISNHTKDTTKILQESKLQWLPLFLNKTLKDRSPISQASFGHYMIFHKQNSDKSSDLFAFDIRDNSIQEANLNGSALSHLDWFTFTKYKENQIIKFGYHKNDQRNTTTGVMERIIIESFKRKISFFMIEEVNYVKSLLIQI